MKNFLKTYKSTLILLAGILVGTIIGIVFGEKATILSPLGDIFLNLMLIVIVPLVFLSITTSISKMRKPKRLGKIMSSIIIIFVVTSLIAVLVGIVSTYVIKLVNEQDKEKIKATLIYDDSNVKEEEIAFLEKTATLVTVNDFTKLLSKDNLIALIVISIIVGIAMNMAGEKANPVKELLSSANVIVENIIKIIMYYAPIGLGCYFAALIGTFGSSIAIGYAKTFIVYTVVSILFFAIVYTVYAFIADGKKGVLVFWKNIIPVTVTALATCSSVASIPISVQTSKKIGVSDDIAETTIPLGTSFHKDGSIIGSVFKIMFLAYLFGTTITGVEGVAQVIGVALFATLLVTAVPIGGGTISEMMIITMMGYPVAALPILTIIATIIDSPATALNVIGNTSASMLVTKAVEGKECNYK